MRIASPDRFVSKSNDDISFGFYGRQGGVSGGIFSSLNCGPGSGDSLEAVFENRARVANDLHADEQDIVTPWQIHSNTCLEAQAIFPNGENRPKGDGLVTDKAGLPLGVLTADCAPVLFHGRKADRSPVIGAAHAGWGGALKGILESTIDGMMQLGAIPTTIRAAIGPCIGPKSYEVSAGFETPFLEEDPSAEHFFKAGAREGHLMFDLPGYVAARLARAGVRDVVMTDHDTYADVQGCFSYRRACHAGEPDYGRQLSAIVIQK